MQKNPYLKDFKEPNPDLTMLAFTTLSCTCRTSLNSQQKSQESKRKHIWKEKLYHYHHFQGADR